LRRTRNDQGLCLTNRLFSIVSLQVLQYFVNPVESPICLILELAFKAPLRFNSKARRRARHHQHHGSCAMEKR